MNNSKHLTETHRKILLQSKQEAQAIRDELAMAERAGFPFPELHQQLNEVESAADGILREVFGEK